MTETIRDGAKEIGDGAIIAQFSCYCTFLPRPITV